MSRILCFALLGLLVAMISGCDSKAEKPDANYSAYLELINNQAKAAEDQRNSFAVMAQKCTSDACVSQVAAIAALAGASGHGAAPPQQFVPRESVAAKFGLALVSQISPLAAAAVSWHQSDVSKDVSIAQFGFLGGSIHDLSASATTLGTATVTAAASMTPSINVGHDYISGSVDNGTHVGRDYVPGTIDNGTHIGGDNVGHDKIDNSGVYIPGTVDRYNSGGPYDDHSASGTGCTGSTTCQTQPPPVTTPTTPSLTP